MRAVLDEIAALLASSPRLDAESRADAAREARLIASAVLGCTPGDVAARLDRTLPFTQAERMRAAAARRARGEPLAYSVGSAPFRDLVLHVDARVLIPRPETEIVVEHALRVCRDLPGGVAVDIGTGSGAIALALATEGRFDRVIATDVSLDALAVAADNVAAVRASVGGAPVELRSGSDLEPVRDVRARVIVSNPPYIAFHEAAALPPSVRDWEPAAALFAADDGMARYDVLLRGACSVLEPGGWVVLEVDARRAAETRDRAAAMGYLQVTLARDLSGRDRVLLAQAPPAAVVHHGTHGEATRNRPGNG